MKAENEKFHISKELVELQKLYQVVEQTADLVMLTDREGIIEYVNPALEQLTGYTKKEFLGKKSSLLKSGQHTVDFYKNMWKILLEGQVFKDILINRKKNGDLYYSEKTITPLKDAQGRITHFVSTDKNITERMAFEQNILKLNSELKAANQGLENFASIASHDLREPLRTISLFTSLLREQGLGKIDETAKKHMGFIINATERMQTLVCDLLEYERVGKGTVTITKVDCNATVNYVISTLKASIESAHAEITHGDLPVVSGNELTLGQLFQNLINNAIKYCKSDHPKIEINALLQKDWIFSIKDNGIGIDSKNWEVIFEPFQRLHGRGEYSGSGIGLATCKKIVALHGGKIWVDSKPGEGSTFYFTIPSLIPEEVVERFPKTH